VRNISSEVEDDQVSVGDTRAGWSYRNRDRRSAVLIDEIAGAISCSNVSR
jgi:hypothetical protein